MYIDGRRRTASSPSSTSISLARYVPDVPLPLLDAARDFVAALRLPAVLRFAGALFDFLRSFAGFRRTGLRTAAFLRFSVFFFVAVAMRFLLGLQNIRCRHCRDVGASGTPPERLLERRDKTITVILPERFCLSRP